jgi:hypothetical protein
MRRLVLCSMIVIAALAEASAFLVSYSSGIRVRHALAIDWTLADRVSLGIGPSLGALILTGDADVEAGAWLHVAAHPWMKRDAASHVRKGLALSLDVTPAAMLSGSPIGALEARYAIHAALGIG